jgi:hypothetical protein
MSGYSFHKTKIVGGKKRKIYKKKNSGKFYLKKKGKFIQLNKKTKGGGGGEQGRGPKTERLRRHL